MIQGKNISYEVKYGKDAPEPPKTARGANFKCICCDTPTTLGYIKSETLTDRMGAVLVAIVAEGNNGRLYISPNEEHTKAAQVKKPSEYPTGELADAPRNIWCINYGLDTFDKLFTNRQLTALTIFSDLVQEAQKQIEHDGGSKEYAQAVGVYLAFAVDKLADLGNALNRWEPNAECPRQLFARQAIPIVWDFAEGNVFSNSSGSWSVLLDNLKRSFNLLCLQTE